MHRSARSGLTIFLALMCVSGHVYPANEEGAGDARLLGSVGEVKNRVYWACRLNACRVNIAFTPKPVVSEKPQATPTQVWLLKADGSTIPGLRALPSDIGATNFEFPLSAQKDAFAVVVRIGDQLHTWWLAVDSARNE